MPPTCRPLPPRIPESKIATSADSCVQSSGHSCCRASDRPPEERSNQRISEHAQLRANGSREYAPDDRLREAIQISNRVVNGLLRRVAPRKKVENLPESLSP